MTSRPFPSGRAISSGTAINEEVDRLRHILKNGKGVMAEMEAKEKEKTGIRTLKIGYNKVFGYYIEVSNAFKEQVPETYIRKQTLVNGERFITQELKDLEHEILTASERVVALEYELFSALRQQIADNAGRIQKTAADGGGVRRAVLLCLRSSPQQFLPSGGGRVRGH